MSYSQEEADLLKENARLRAENEALKTRGHAGCNTRILELIKTVEAAEANVAHRDKLLAHHLEEYRENVAALTEENARLKGFHESCAALTAKLAQAQEVVEAAKVWKLGGGLMMLNDALSRLSPAIPTGSAPECRDCVDMTAGRCLEHPAPEKNPCGPDNWNEEGWCSVHDGCVESCPPSPGKDGK